jgi:hypothetical protein
MRRDWWPFGLFALHAVQALVLGHLYPKLVYDPDLVAYLVYFRNWVAHSSGLHGIPYFTVPKPLLVFGFGPTGSVSVAFLCSAAASGAVGTLAYRLGDAVFGRATGILLSLLLLLDVEKMTLTLRSSADLYVGVLLLVAIDLSLRRRLRASALCILLSALVKPVTLPCALHFLAREEVDRRTRWTATLLPFVAVPLILVSNLLLLGTATAPGDFFARFGALGEGTPVGPEDVVHFVFWTQLARHTFVWSAPFGAIGLFLWLKRDKTRLTSPFLLVPLLFVGGYVGLGFVSPYVPFFRFFWLVEAWFAGFVVFGMRESAAFLARGRHALATAATAVILLLVATDYGTHLRYYRDHFAVPFDSAMAFVATTPDVLRRERVAGETILAPLAFMPYLVWQLGIDDPRGVVVTAEQAAFEGRVGRPDWIVYVPNIFASRAAHDVMLAVAHEGGYDVRLTDGTAALLALPTAGRSAARGGPTP